jgi:type IV pilus assembly protein PilW
MNAMYARQCHRRARTQRGFTLVELMVTVGIALFLLWGLTTVLQNVRTANLNQQGLSQLQDEERFALTVITDVVQAGGYLPDATAYTPATSLPTCPPGCFGNTLEAGQAFFGTHQAAAPGDTLLVRYRTGLTSTAVNDGVILCDGSTNTGQLPSYPYTNVFSVVAQGPGVVGGLYCQVDNGGPSANPPGVLLVPGVQSMTVYYGVKRDFTLSDYNVDTYLTADQMCSPILNPCGTDDWSNISAVRVILTFTNPLANQPGQQPTITFERVIEVMARGGIHT